MKKKFLKTIGAVSGAALAVMQVLPVLAVTFTSTNFQIIDPQFQSGGVGISTSAAFSLIGTLSEQAIGRSTSAANILVAGSLGYPRCTEPTLTGIPQAGQNVLTWTAATCQAGWTFSQYQVCEGAAANTYTTCTNVGGVLTSTRTATGGQIMFYRIRVIATGAASQGTPAGNYGSRSGELALTASSATGGGGGGGGGGAPAGVTSLRITYPNGGEQIVAGTTVNITWTSTGTGISTVRLLLSTDGGASFGTTIATNESNDGTYTWTVPNITDADMRVKLEGLGPTGAVVVTDISDANFAAGPVGAIPTPVAAPVTPAVPTVSDVDVTLRGFASPGSRVTVLRDGATGGVGTADTFGVWSVSMLNLTPGGQYTFTMFATDTAGRRTASVPVTVILPTTISVFGIENLLLPPTLAATDASIAPGESLQFTGWAIPGSSVTVELTPSGRTATVVAPESGNWVLSLSTQGLAAGAYTARTRVTSDEGTSIWSDTLSIVLEGAAVAAPRVPSGDLNGNGRVDLSDVSLLLAWWKKNVPPAPVSVDLKRDNFVNLADLSILLHGWTG